MSVVNTFVSIDFPSIFGTCQRLFGIVIYNSASSDYSTFTVILDSNDVVFVRRTVRNKVLLL